MKKKKMMDMIGLADEKYVSEADPDNCISGVKTKTSKPGAKPFYKKKWITVAACLLVAITALNMVLFIPYGTRVPSVEKYKNSEYYSIIQKLNLATYREPRYKNNFQLLQDSFMNFAPTKDDAALPEAAPPTNDVGLSGGNGNYVEVTDNQVSGVTEADRIKRSDKYIYYLANNQFYVYSINGEESELVGAYSFESYANAYYNEWEFYLSKDCNTVTVVLTYYDMDKNSACVSLVSLDVSDPSKISEKGRITVVGGYVSTRVADGKLLLMTNFRVPTTNGRPNFDDEFSFIPSIDKGNGFELLPIEDIITPETLSDARYTVVCKLDEQTLEFEDATALLSYSENVYVSADKIFATLAYTSKEELEAEVYGKKGYYESKSMTDISVISYKETEMKYLGTVTVEGYVKDQYSLDEYEGILRVVTTTNSSVARTSSSNRVTEPTMSAISGTSASLYCISLENYEVISSVCEFAPRGETVRSVRFDGTDAYVCTAVQLTDPVFFFDLSDMNNITYKETGTIEGFSTSLVNFGNGYLLGVGVGDRWDSLKIEIYEEGKNGVVSVCAYELPNTYYSEEYKSYYIDRQNQMIGLPVSTYTTIGSEAERYILLGFDGYKLREILNVELPGYPIEIKRGVLIDDFMYLFSQDVFKVFNIYEASEAPSLDLGYVVSAVVTTLPDGKEYVFDDYGTMKIVDYLERLSLSTDFSENYNEYGGVTYEIYLTYTDGSVCEIYHMGNKFLLVKGRSVYMMDYNQAAQFEDLVEALN